MNLSFPSFVVQCHDEGSIEEGGTSHYNDTLGLVIYQEEHPMIGITPYYTALTVHSNSR